MTGSRQKVLSQTDVRVSDAPVRVGESPLAMALAASGSPSDPHGHSPELSVEHDGAGNVVRIHVRCQCGEDITISCEYSDAA